MKQEYRNNHSRNKIGIWDIDVCQTKDPRYPRNQFYVQMYRNIIPVVEMDNAGLNKLNRDIRKQVSEIVTNGIEYSSKNYITNVKLAESWIPNRVTGVHVEIHVIRLNDIETDTTDRNVYYNLLCSNIQPRLTLLTEGINRVIDEYNSTDKYTEQLNILEELFEL